MMMIVHTKIQKWGNGLALRVSGGMRDIPHFEEGTEVDVEIFEEGFLVKRSVAKKINLFPYSECQLLEGLDQKTSHSDLLTNPLSNELE
jgi:antitoxin MazE